MAWYEYIAFINTEKAKELGISLENICNPYQLINDKNGLGVVFAKPRNPKEEQELESSELYRQYQQDPKYVRKLVGCGN